MKRGVIMPQPISGIVGRQKGQWCNHPPKFQPVGKLSACQKNKPLGNIDLVYAVLPTSVSKQ